MYRLRRVRAGVPGDRYFRAGGLAGEVAELYARKCRLVREEVARVPVCMGFGGTFQRAAFLFRGLSLRELPQVRLSRTSARSAPCNFARPSYSVRLEKAPSLCRPSSIWSW